MDKLFFLVLLVHYYHVSADSILQTVEIPDWKRAFSKNGINNECRFDQNNNCIGMCSKTSSNCEKMKHFDEIVCGCRFCLFDSLLSKCSGQCSNTFLETCVSKIAIPKENSDCICAGCSATWFNVAGQDSNELNIPSCDESTCYPGNSCSPIYASRNHEPINSTLYCQCNNNNIPR
jgi:hypothetical protein